MTTQVQVCVDLYGKTVPVGTLYANEKRTFTSTFVYQPAYLADSRVYALEPRLSMASGEHHAAGLPGCIGDAAPDRWGRNLIRKRLRAVGELGGRELTELDYLLGVSDSTRQGALRFSQGGDFLAEQHVEVPKFVSLLQLLRASERVARDEDSVEELKLLLDAGSSSLGGARPKASVQDDGVLHVAKFPHPGDSWDVMAWEATALDLAERAGIDVPARRLLRIDGRAVLVLQRFDRRGSERVGYISAMTLLRATDGDQRDYLEIAEELAVTSADPTADLAQLWRRIALGFLMNNTDDHLRNHGLIREINGWRLSPIFDINPNPDGGRHATSIGGEDTAEAGIEALMVWAKQFGLSSAGAVMALADVRSALVDWRSVAKSNGVTVAECDRMRDAFIE
ncbi:MAG: type II toxin-antitoxin system HipA family toxin [Propionibacteriaceae bacterium]